MKVLNFMLFRNRFLFILLTGIFFIPVVTDSFAAIPSGPIAITIENVTVNTPPSESTPGNSLLDTAISQALTFIGVVIAAAVAAAFKFMQDKKTPTTPEQEKIFNETVQEAYYQSYLPIWEKIWEIISSKDDATEFINNIWEKYLGKKRLPTRKQLEDLIDNQNTMTEEQIPEDATPKEKELSKIEWDILFYAREKAKSFKLNSITSNNYLLVEKMKNLVKSADVKYYTYVTDNISKFVEKAVLATDNVNRDLTDDAQITNWKKNAMQELKRIMIFAFMREDIKVMESLINAEINKIIFQRVEKEKVGDRVTRTNVIPQTVSKPETLVVHDSKSPWGTLPKI